MRSNSGDEIFSSIQKGKKASLDAKDVPCRRMSSIEKKNIQKKLNLAPTTPWQFLFCRCDADKSKILLSALLNCGVRHGSCIYCWPFSTWMIFFASEYWILFDNIYIALCRKTQFYISIKIIPAETGESHWKCQRQRNLHNVSHRYNIYAIHDISKSEK